MNGLPFDFATGALGATVLAATLVVAVPRRGVPAAMLAWVAAPVLVYLGIVGWEVLHTAWGTDSARNYAFGLLLVGSVVALPWLVLCAAGFGIGFALRAVLRPRRPAMPVTAAMEPLRAGHRG